MTCVLIVEAVVKMGDDPHTPARRDTSPGPIMVGATTLSDPHLGARP